MNVRKVNIDYKIQKWVTVCSNCKSELEFDDRDKQMFIYNDIQKYFIKCPICGKYIKCMH